MGKILWLGIKLIPVVLAFAHLHFGYCECILIEEKDAVALAAVSRSRNDEENTNLLSEMGYVALLQKACKADTKIEDIERFQITKKTADRIMKNLQACNKNESLLKVPKTMVTFKVPHNVCLHRLKQAYTSRSCEKICSYKSNGDNNSSDTENLLNILCAMTKRDTDIIMKYDAQSKVSSISVDLMCLKSEDNFSYSAGGKVNGNIVKKKSALPNMSQNPYNETQSECFDGNDKGNGHSKSQQSSSHTTQHAGGQSSSGTPAGNGVSSETSNTQGDNGDGDDDDDGPPKESIRSGYCQTSVNSTTEGTDTSCDGLDPNQPVDDGILGGRDGPVPFNTLPLLNPDESNVEIVERDDDSPGVLLLYPREGGSIVNATANEITIPQQSFLPNHPLEIVHGISALEKPAISDDFESPGSEESTGSEELDAASNSLLHEINENGIQPPTASDLHSDNQSMLLLGDGGLHALAPTSGTDQTAALYDTGQLAVGNLDQISPAPNIGIDSTTPGDDHGPANVLDDLLNQLHGNDANEILEIDVHAGQSIQAENQPNVERPNRTFDHPAGHYGRAIVNCRGCNASHILQRFHVTCPDCGRFYCVDCVERHNCSRVFQE